MSILEKIRSPKDIKLLKPEELEALASEIRSRIVSVVSKTGGHLSSNLGAVELTLALHYVFDCPRDKIIWDVGHQCYTHKLLTGRQEKFETIRQYNGLSGFPKREESEYDVFDSGHSSTSISAALGMACARDLKKEDFNILAVIGDGSMTSGIAFEGLNQAGGMNKDLIVILNDNEMSISKNVGGLAHYFNRLITAPRYNKLRTDMREIVKGVPVVGQKIVNLGERLEEGIKGMIVPGGLFEEMGFRYFGPIDGHNIAELIDNFNKIKNIKGARIIHVVTKKGKGYSFAEENPSVFHGIPSFDTDTGRSVPSGNGLISFSKSFSSFLVGMAEQDKNIVAITAAMSLGTGLAEFSKKFPERFFDAGIAEEHAIVLAAGMALRGLKPIVAVYSTFLQRAYDQILHDICLQNLPVIIIVAHSGIVGEDGPTHHGLFDISYLRHIPNLVFMSPKDEKELKDMLKTATKLKSPVAIRYPKMNGFGLDTKPKAKILEIGKAEVLKDDGKDGVIFAIGPMVYSALEAAKILKENGMIISVINARFIKPLDKNLILAMIRKNKNIVTIEENVLEGGFGSAICELLEENNLSGKVCVKRLGLPDKFIEHGSREIILKKYGLDAEGIAKSIKNWLSREK